MSTVKAKQILPFILLVAVAIIAMFIKPAADYVPGASETPYSSSDIAWVLVSTALVFLMTPGLAFFYGGMVNRKNVISTMIKSVVAAGIVGVIWIVCGFSLAFGESVGGVIGNPSTFAFFKGVKSGAPWAGAPTIPLTLFSLFQLMFAIITPGLVVGAVAERIICFIHCPLCLAGIRPGGTLELASRRLPGKNGCLGFCRGNCSTHYCRMCCTGRCIGFKTTEIAFG
jgi:Amt family ammonium transporter